MTLFDQTPLVPYFSFERITILAPTTGEQLFRDDWRRIAILIQNLGANNVFINFGQTATVGQGLLIRAGDPPLQLTFRDFGTLVSQSIFVVADIMDSQLGGFATLYAPIRNGRSTS